MDECHGPGLQAGVLCARVKQASRRKWFVWFRSVPRVSTVRSSVQTQFVSNPIASLRYLLTALVVSAGLIHPASAKDTQKPSAPTGLTATAASSTQINLSWTASTDNVAVTGYLVERCSGASCSTFAQIATPTTTTFSDTGRTASTSYSYRVRATDAASNLSSYSSIASVTTQAIVDTTAPSVPTGLSATAASISRINLTWAASTDSGGSGLAGYRIYRNGIQISTSTTTNYSDAGLSAANTYSYAVRAYDGAGNASAASTAVNVTTPSQSTGASGSVTYQYDDAGRLKNTIFYDGSAKAYTLDAAGNRTAVAAVSGAGAFTLSVANSVTENAGALTVTVNRIGSSAGAASVQYATSNGTAIAGSDYTATTGTLNWANGDTTSKSFSVPIASDGVYESDETFVLALSNPSAGATLGTPNQATITIAANGTAPTFAVSNSLSVSEGAGVMTVTITKTGGTAFTHAVSYATADGTATAGSDYTATSGTLTFAPTDTSKTFTVSIANDAMYEGNENFAVNLSGATNGAAIANSTGTVTIVDDDPPPSFAINSVSASEAAGTMTFTVTKSGGTAFTHTVSYATADGTATAGSDYTATSGTLTFAPSDTSKTITVGLVNDNIYETTENFTVSLSAATNGAVISAASATGTILDDDLIAPVLTVAGVSSSQVNLSWTPTTNGSGSYYYVIIRDGADFNNAGITATTYSDTQVSPGQAHSYIVYTYDRVTGAYSTISNTVTATTLPSTPTGLSATAVSSTQVNLSWGAASSGFGIQGYKIYRNGTQINTTTGSSTGYSDTGLSPNTTYTYSVAAYDANNPSAQSNSVSATTQIILVPPTLNVSVSSATQVNLTWTSPTNGSGSYLYYVYRDGAYINYSVAPASVDAGLSAGTTHSYLVAAWDNNLGIWSAYSNAATATTPPTTPTGLTATVQSSSKILLVWSPSNSGFGITGYRVYRNGTLVASPTVTYYTDTGLTPSTTYSYTVTAYDNAGNTSASSSSVSGTTPLGDTITMTQGNNVSYYIGYKSGMMGSISPGTLTGGKTLTSFDDEWVYYGAPYYYLYWRGIVAVSGFSSDPGAAWLVSATANGVTWTGPAAGYTYSGGTAQWQTGAFGFTGSGTTTVVINHR